MPSVVAKYQYPQGIDASTPPEMAELVEVLREFVAHKVVLIVPDSRIDTSKMPSKVFLDVPLE